MAALAALGAVALTIPAAPPASANSQGAILYQRGGGDNVGYGRSIQLQHSGAWNGTILSTFEHWHYGAGAQPCIIRQSTDEGRSWTTLANVFDPQGSDTIWQPALFEMPQQMGNYPAGTLVLVFDAVEPGNPNLSELKLFHSTDHGASWTYSNTFEVGRNDQHGVWEPALVMDGLGRLVCYFSDERQAPNYSQFLNAIPSTDGGDHWGAEFPVVYHQGSNVRPGMATVVKLPNGQYMLAYENGGDQGYTIWCKTSPDGINWGNVADYGSQISTPDGRYPTGSPQMVWDPLGGPNGTLVLDAQVGHVAGGGIGMENNQILYTSTNLGQGQWNWMPTPFWASAPNDPDATTNYSPNLMLSGDGRTVRVTTKSGDERTDASNAGVLPYYSPFVFGNDAGWMNYGGAWSVSGSAYHDSDNGGGNKAISGSTGWTNYTLSGDVQVNAGGQAGFLVRASNPGVGYDALNGYYVGLSTNGAVFSGRENGGWTPLASASVTGGVAANTWYHVTISAQGANFSVTVQPSGSGTVIGSLNFTDATFPSGAIGVRDFLTPASWRAISVTNAVDNGPLVNGHAYHLINMNSGLFLDNPNGTNVHGTYLQQFVDTFATAQQWTATNAGGNSWVFANVAGGLAIDDYNWSTTAGTLIDEWDNWGGAVQQWQVVPVSANTYRLISNVSGMNMEIQNASLAPGGAVGQFPNNGAACQYWYLQPL
ncbi:RICIN domain-containing protein [Capsulimonas corticalis]|nr:RICIN domain-containing protein [Capsulimonas corticalis]